MKNFPRQSYTAEPFLPGRDGGKGNGQNASASDIHPVYPLIVLPLYPLFLQVPSPATILPFPQPIQVFSWGIPNEQFTERNKA